MPYFLGHQGYWRAISFKLKPFLLDGSEAQKIQELNETYKAQKVPEIYKIHKAPSHDDINSK